MCAMIRKARVRDLPSILALYSEIEEADCQPPSLKSARKTLSRIQSYPDYGIYVVSSRDRIVGTFALLIMDNLAHHGTPSGVVEDVVVAKHWQRKGIGRQMMKYAMKRCREAGCYKLALSSNVKRVGAHRFYKSLGFKKHGYSFAADMDS